MRSIHINRDGTGYPLVLFHGWGFDSRIWQPILPLLTHQYEVYTVDLPGFGLTSFMDWDEFKEGLLLQLPSTFALAGWSLGGMVATRLALEAMNRVTHLINIASSPRFIEDDGWPGVSVITLTQFGERLMTQPEQVLQEFMALQLSGKKSSINAAPTLQGLKMGLDCLMNWDFRSDLERLKLPVLYLFGRRDAIIPKKTMVVIQAMYPNVQCVMTNKAAHALFLSHPNEFIQSIESIIR